jgi:TRAP-type C4-dicarboxylate transport system permease small subunit
MKPNTHFVCGGGWVTRQTVGRPRARLFGLFSLVWLSVSFCATMPFWNGWPSSFGWPEWIYVALLVPQPIFAGLALASLITDPPRTITQRQRNPDHDIRKLY